jgi:Kef-type K+ transport system membrane component KefB
VAISVALVEVVVGGAAGNHRAVLAPWVNSLAGFGAMRLTFLAGTEIDPQVVRKHFWASMSIGAIGLFAPYLECCSWATTRWCGPWSPTDGSSQIS